MPRCCSSSSSSIRRRIAAASFNFIVAATVVAAAAMPRASGHPNCLADVISAEGLELDHLERRADWSYEGKSGPENWGQFSATCAMGSQQSPINFDGDELTITDGSSNPNVKAWKAVASAPVQFVNNGHTVQLQLAPLMQSTVQAKNKTYTLRQVHFHAPSEHHVSERDYPLEAHFVHSDGSNLNVIGLFFEIGEPSPFLAQLVGSIPVKENATASIARLDLSSVISHISTSSFWSYTGSLTTPPCSEGVLWVVAKQALTVSPAQYDALRRVMRFNSRPTQENDAAEGDGGRRFGAVQLGAFESNSTNGTDGAQHPFVGCWIFQWIPTVANVVPAVFLLCVIKHNYESGAGKFFTFVGSATSLGLAVVTFYAEWKKTSTCPAPIHQIQFCIVVTVLVETVLATIGVIASLIADDDLPVFVMVVSFFGTPVALLVQLIYCAVEFSRLPDTNGSALSVSASSGGTVIPFVLATSVKAGFIFSIWAVYRPFLSATFDLHDAWILKCLI
ncbi:alpha carbonic anhydrase [Zopfochytrium polystomum]|nr:alpha carbonic anhydrase [Zopfochytrium polystomum]